MSESITKGEVLKQVKDALSEPDMFHLVLLFTGKILPREAINVASQKYLEAVEAAEQENEVFNYTVREFIIKELDSEEIPADNPFSKKAYPKERFTIQEGFINGYVWNPTVERWLKINLVEAPIVIKEK